MDFRKTATYCERVWPEQCRKNEIICEDLLNNTFHFNMPWDLEAVHEPVHFQNEIDWLHCPGIDLEFVYQLNRHRFLINLAQGYQLTGNEAYAKKWMGLLLHWIENVTRKKDRFGLAWRSLEVGLRAATWLHSYHILKDCPLLTDSFLDRFNASLKEHQSVLLEVKQDKNYLSNWGVIQNHGLFAIACHFGERDLREGSLRVAFERLLRQSETQIMTDGVQWEQSPLYHNEVLQCFLDVLIFGKRCNISFPATFLENVKKMAHTLIKWIKPDGTHPLLGDSDRSDLAEILTKAAAVFEDGFLKFKAFSKLDFESAWMMEERTCESYEKIEPKTPDFTEIFLEDSGNYILRENWSEKSNYLHFINGFTGGGHAHADKLHVDLCVKGKDILVDSGRYTYVGVNRKRHLLKAPSSHNTITLDHKKFIRNDITGWALLKRAEAIKMPVITHDEFTILQGKHLGYLSLIGGSVVGRTVIWLKPDIYIFCDQFNAKGLHSVQRYFNFALDCKLLVGKNKIEVQTDKRKVLFYFPDKKVRLKRKRSYYSECYNRLQSGTKICDSIVTVGSCARLTVIDASGSASVQKNTVYGNGKRLRDQDAQALRITIGQDIYDVIFCHKELMDYVKINETVGGAGRLLIFKNEKKLGFYW